MTSLSDRISRRISRNPQKKRSGQVNYAFVVCNNEDIEEAVSDGWPLTVIYEQYKKEEKFFGSYQAFRRAWNKFIETRENELKNKFEDNNNSTAVDKSKKNNGPKIFKTKVNDFTFDNTKKKS